jgi:hypothetical protein
MGTGAWQGNVTVDVVLTNLGLGGCFLSGPPAMTLSSGGVAPVTVQLGRSSASRVELMPRQQVEMILECRGLANSVATTLTLMPTGGGVMSVPVQLPAGCPGATLTTFQQGPALDPSSGAGALLIKVSLPAVGSRGQMVNYTVTLQNASAEPVALSPCPSYTQIMSQPQADGVTILKTQSTYLLNCAVNAVSAHGEISFQMRIQVPSIWKVLPAKFLWIMETYGQPAAGGVIQIT